jgi:hypothetical protein
MLSVLLASVAACMFQWMKWDIQKFVLLGRFETCIQC